MAGAQYEVLLARAFPGADPDRLLWHISRVRGWSVIHASGILNGEAFIWADPRLSAAGRAMLRVQDLQEKYRRGEWRPEVDL